MVRAAAAENVTLQVEQGYVAEEALAKKNFDDTVSRLVSEGRSKAKAEAEALENYSARRQKNEWSTGLLIRFANPGGGDFSNSDAYKWLSDHSVDYGFVIRYPENKTEVTGIETAQPQVFRFVGVENAEKNAGLGLLRGGIRRLYPGAKGRLLIQSAFGGIQRGPKKARRKALSSKCLRGGCVFLKNPIQPRRLPLPLYSACRIAAAFFRRGGRIDDDP